MPVRDIQVTVSFFQPTAPAEPAAFASAPPDMGAGVPPGGDPQPLTFGNGELIDLAAEFLKRLLRGRGVIR